MLLVHNTGQAALPDVQQPTKSFSAFGADWYCGSFSGSYASFAQAFGAVKSYTDSCPVAGVVNFDSCSRWSELTLPPEGYCVSAYYPPPSTQLDSMQK